LNNKAAIRSSANVAPVAFSPERHNVTFHGGKEKSVLVVTLSGTLIATTTIHQSAL
jgi:hypothetical protein